MAIQKAIDDAYDKGVQDTLGETTDENKGFSKTQEES